MAQWTTDPTAGAPVTVEVHVRSPVPMFPAAMAQVAAAARIQSLNERPYAMGAAIKIKKN